MHKITASSIKHLEFYHFCYLRFVYLHSKLTTISNIEDCRELTFAEKFPIFEVIESAKEEGEDACLLFVKRKGCENMDDNIQLTEFERYLKSQNMAENTMRAYLFAVKQYYQLYPELNFQNMQLYKVYLLEHYKPQTVNLRIHALNCFLKYKESPDEHILQVKVQQKEFLDRVISEGDYEYLKSRLLGEERYRYYFLVRFMAATGARVSEVVQFTVEDVKRGYKDLYSKDNKVRRIYIPEHLQNDTFQWLAQNGPSHGDLFRNPSGGRISPGGIRRQLKRLAIRYNLDEGVMYPHSFRHRFAKSFMERSSDITLLSNLLGHESIETTRIYLRRSSSEQQAIVNQIVDW